FPRQLAKTLAMGQGLAALICGTAITSQYLATDFHVDTPMLQSFLNYVLLCVTYTPILVCRQGDENILQILKSKWWKYVLLALVDVEANYTVVKAYQYTTLTSVQLLDCFVVPVLMVLSWWILKTRFKLVHYVAVCICVLGVGTMVGADLLAGRDQGSSKFISSCFDEYLFFWRIILSFVYVPLAANILLGDGLVLLSASFYAVSNVCQEYTVKNLTREEFLGMVGLFGTIISTIQMVILERTEIGAIHWNWKIGLLFCGFALCLYTLYSCMPIVIKLSSATSVNLSLMTADLFSLFFGIFLFHYMFSGLYLVSLVIILIGSILFNAVPTQTDPADPLPSVCEEGFYENTVATLNYFTNQGTVLRLDRKDAQEENTSASSRTPKHEEQSYQNYNVDVSCS
ncbi:hypothetical protein NQD34_009425, partial [Periophthalmus magnuspinnatus]